MDYSAKDLLLHPGQRKPTSCSTRIIQVALAMLIITTCIVLLVAPTAFLTLFMLESFHSKSTVETPIKSSILISKLLPHVKDENLNSGSSMKDDEIFINVPEIQIDQLLDQLEFFVNKKKEPNQRLKRSNAIEQLSTKDIIHLIELLNSIQYHGKNAQDISKEYQTKLNNVMDTLGLRKKRDTKESFYNESKNAEVAHDDRSGYVENDFQESTIYRLLSILDDLQNGGISLNEVDDYDRNILNYFMDLEGL